MSGIVLRERDIIPSERELIALEAQLPTPPWMWRDREGNYHYPSDMESRHLFHILRMIWNKTMPEEEWVGNVGLYTFDPQYYGGDYFAQAVRHLGAEIETRTDLLPEWIEQLDRMIPGFSTRKIENANP